MKRKVIGFTLIELMIVIAIIGILSTMAIPTYQDYIIRGQIAEANKMVEGVKQSVTEYYSSHHKFPADNHSAGVPDPRHMIGNYVTSVMVENGAIHITLGNRINALAKGKVLSWRPASVDGNRTSPIAWLCGFAQPVTGMSSPSENKTTLPGTYLDPSCRSWQETHSDKSVS